MAKLNLATFNCPVRVQALQSSQRIAIYSGEEKITYYSLDQRIEYLKGQLSAQGLKKNDNFAACSENGVALIVLLFACLRIGVRFCPLNYRFTQTEKKTILDSAGVRYYWQEDGQSLDGLVNLTNLSFATSEQASNAPLTTYLIDSHRPATIIFTSGSSGLPKAAVHSLANHYFSALGSQSMIPLTSQDCWLASLPFYHISGLAIIMRCFLAGASLALTQPNELNQSLIRYPVTHASLVPTQLYRLLQDKNWLSGLHYILLGGAPIEKKLLQQAEDFHLTIFHSYGLTEMSSQVATSPVDVAGYLQTLPYRHWQLVNGEIAVQGETLFLGYLVKGVIQQATRDGWFYTGDLAEEKGTGIEIVGRCDNQFICGGENYQPEAIEKLINEFPAVSKVVILPMKDKEYGAIPIAYIEWADEPQEVALGEFLKARIARFKIPREFRPWPQMADTSLKINRRALSTKINSQ